MPTFNASLIPTFVAGTVFDRFLNDQSINIRWLTANDPVFFEAVNRPIADVLLRQLIIAKTLDTLNSRIGYSALFPFLLTPQISRGVLVTTVPTRLFWDMKVTLSDRWSNLRLARVTRVSGSNTGSYTGTIRFLFSADDAESTNAETGLFFVDYAIDSGLTYQIVNTQTASGGVTSPLPDSNGESFSGTVVFKTADSTDITFSTFYDFVAPGSTKYEVVDTEGSEAEIFDALPFTHGKGLLVPAAYNLTPSAGSALIQAGSDKVEVTVTGTTSTVDINLANCDHALLANVGLNSHATIDMHLADNDNPHNVTALQVGSATALWNAMSLQGSAVDTTVPVDGDLLTYHTSINKWVPAQLDASIIPITLPDGAGDTNLQDAITNKLIPALDQNHDDRYYTHTEVNALIAASSTLNYILLRDQKDTGENGGKVQTASTWFNRNINTEVNDEGSNAQVLTNNISVITRSTTTATVTCTAHGFVTGDNVTIAGATQTQYNGSFSVVVVDANTFTFTVSGSPATPATGTVICYSNKFTLTSGRYYARISVPAYDVDSTRARLYNLTDSSAVLYSQTTRAGTPAAATIFAVIEGYFVLTSTKTFAIQQMCEQAGSSSQLLGPTTNPDGSPEIYTTVQFWRRP